MNLGAQKRAFDVANSEGIAFETSGGGSSSTARLENDGDVVFQPSDQYCGINDVVYEGNTCVLFNWASLSNKKKNVAMTTLVKATGETITKGRSLEGDIAAHNLCVVSDPRAIGESPYLVGHENVVVAKLAQPKPSQSRSSPLWVTPHTPLVTRLGFAHAAIVGVIVTRTGFV